MILSIHPSIHLFIQSLTSGSKYTTLIEGARKPLQNHLFLSLLEQKLENHMCIHKF